MVVISGKAKYVTDGHQFVRAHNSVHMMQKRTLLPLLSQLTLLGPSNPRSMYLHIWFGSRDCHGLGKGTASLRMHLDCFSAHALLKERGQCGLQADTSSLQWSSDITVNAKMQTSTRCKVSKKWSKGNQKGGHQHGLVR